MKNSLFANFGAAALLLAAAAFGDAIPRAEAAPPVSNLRFENLTNRHQNAPTNTVQALLQDRQGFIWMGTQGGLYRFDGHRVKIYRNDPQRADSLPGDYVATLLRDSKDRIWVGTNNGLALFDPVRDSFTTYRAPAEIDGPRRNEFIRKIAEDGKGGLWLGTNNGLQLFNPADGKFKSWRHDAARSDSLATDLVWSLAPDPKGGVWIAAWPSGIDYLAPGSDSFQHYQLDSAAQPDPKLNTVNALMFDERGQLWIGSAKGMLRWQTGTDWSSRELLPMPAGFSEYSVYTIYSDPRKEVWVGSQPAGLLRWSAANNAFSSYLHRPGDSHSLPSSRIPAVLVDRTNTLWAGTWDGGVSRVDLATEGFDRFIPGAWGDQKIAQGNVIGSLAQRPDGQLWLGGPGGLRLFDNTTRRVVRTYVRDPEVPGSLPNNFVISLYQDPKGPLWLGSSSGLARLDSADGKFREIRFPQKAANLIRTIVPARAGGLWLGTDGGLLRYEPESGATTFLLHDPKDPGSRSTNSANAILEDRKGRLWVGSPYGFGLDMRDPATGKFTHYRHETGKTGGLSNDFVTSLYEDADGRVWVGTANGLNQVIETTRGAISFLPFTTAHGLLAHDIFAITGDANGVLWLTLTAGLSRFDTRTGEVRNFLASDGITDGNFVSQAALRGADGLLYFGGFRGMTIVRPEAVRSNAIPPRVAVTDISVFNRSLAGAAPQDMAKLEGPVTEPRQLTLAPEAQMFSVEFAAMHYADPTRNRYRYRLEGFDREWMEVDASQRTATYTNLDPGAYQFRVKAANKDGIWEEQGVNLPITVLPPPWKTWWFRLGAILLGMALLGLLFRWRVARLRKNQLRLESLVGERTGELAAKNAALSDAYEKLENLSVTDHLTGLRNRRFLEQELPGDVSLATRRYEAAGAQLPLDSALIFFMIDLDHFKRVNDDYGHDAGDGVLTLLRERLQSVFRETDYLVRWGGEEFLVVARGANPANAPALAERLRNAIAGQDFVLEDGLELTQSCSIGYASYPFCPSQPRLASWQKVVRMADLALYGAKRAGRDAWAGIVCTDDGLDAEGLEEMLQKPALALAAGAIALESSVGDDALLAAWEQLH